jgi:B9 domain-containing protein 1
MAAELVLSVQGQILSCLTDTGSNAFCRFVFHSGSEWGIISGAEDGVSQIARIDTDHTCTLNSPLNVVFKSAKPFGWPQVIYSVYDVNSLGRQSVIGS